MILVKKLFYSAVVFLLISFTFTVNTYAGNHNNGGIRGRPTSVPPTGVDAGERGLKRACEAVENSIKTRSDKIVLLAEKILEKFDNISLRVQEYYMTKLVPEGYTVENYDGLLAEIEARSDDVQSALVEAEASADEFDCDSEDPKGTLMQFKEEMLAVVDALRQYRLAIKDLIVAINTVVAA